MNKIRAEIALFRNVLSSESKKRHPVHSPVMPLCPVGGLHFNFQPLGVTWVFAFHSGDIFFVNLTPWVVEIAIKGLKGSEFFEIFSRLFEHRRFKPYSAQAPFFARQFIFCLLFLVQELKNEPHILFLWQPLKFNLRDDKISVLDKIVFRVTQVKRTILSY